MQGDTEPSPHLRILVGADVPPDPNSGAAGTVFQMNAALRRMGHIVDEIWAPELGRKMKHGNLHYLLELPSSYRRAVRRRLSQGPDYDVIELNQPHAYLAAVDHRRNQRSSIFLNRSHGHEARAVETLAPWQKRLQVADRGGLRRIASNLVRRLLDRQWEIISRNSDGFVVSCQEDADFLALRYQVDHERIGVITQGVPEAFLERAPAPPDDARRLRLLYVGQLAFFKAPAILGRAASAILRRVPECTMTWVCSAGHHASAIRFFDEDLRSRVSLIDWMPQEDLLETFDRHGIFLFPSFFEGFGKAPLEAMSRGLCVVASRAGGMRDYIHDAQNGFLVPIGAHEQMAESALTVIENPEIWRRISNAARSTALEHTWDRCARDAEAFYLNMLRLKSDCRQPAQPGRCP